MQTVFIVQAFHPSQDGTRLSVHASHAGAVARAVELTAIILADSEMESDVGEVTADNWESVAHALEDYHGAAHASVWIDSEEVRP